MCFRDVMTLLLDKGLTVTEQQIRWAISSGKVARPPLDGSLRFVFGEEQVGQLVAYFRRRAAESASTASE
jgi:hypothetical protein